MAGGLSTRGKMDFDKAGLWSTLYLDHVGLSMEDQHLS
jgi:hypothetical protein